MGDKFEMTLEGHEKAKQWLRDNGFHRILKSEDKMKGWSLVSLANRLWREALCGKNAI